MAKFIIQGRKKLSGEIWANPGKNYILPVLAATLLTDKPCILHNVPKIRDVDYMLTIMQHLGASVTYLDENTLQIQASSIDQTDVPQELSQKLRASMLVLGPLLARTGKATLYHPGGDVIGRRSIDTHLLGFEQLGVKVEREDDHYSLKTKKLAGHTVVFDEISVTGTENILLATASIPNVVSIKHAATEPHVQELCKVLHKMGVRIEGIGASNIKICGSERLEGFEHTFGADHVEVGTWAVLAGVLKTSFEIHNVNREYLDMIKLVLERFGLEFSFHEQKHYLQGLNYTPYTMKVSAEKLRAVPKVDALPWPGFPTDLISLLIVLATQAHGVTLVRDWMYEGRMFFTDKLIRMGANIILCDPHRVLVYGEAPLTGKTLESPDIRAGMALVLAALAARGESVISNVEHIERDYADVVTRLRALGAAIERIEG